MILIKTHRIKKNKRKASTIKLVLFLYGCYMDTKAFAECMKRNMDKQGVTTEDLSKMTEIPVSRLEEYQSGDFKAKAKEIYAISAAIKVPPMALMHGGGLVHISELDENGHRVCRWEEY